MREGSKGEGGMLIEGGIQGGARDVDCGSRGVRGGARAPLYTCPPERLRGGPHGGGSFNITSACISLPQDRHIGVLRGGGLSPLVPLGVPGGALPHLENTKLKGNYV